MKPIKAEAIGQMREILSGIVLKKLRHNQSFWHCGTAHCVAGWNTVLNHAELYTRRKRGDDMIYTVFSRDGGDGDRAQKDWGLTEREANFMFGAHATRAQQIGLIDFLADGRRYVENADRKELIPYVKRYQGDKALRIAWAKQYEQPRPNCEIVADLLTQSSGKKIVEQIVEVEYATSDQNNGYR